MTKNKSKDSKQQKQLKELAYQVQRFVNLKLNPPESAEEDHIPPALSPRPKSAKEGYQDALSGLTLLTPEQLSTMGFDVATKSTPAVQQSKSKTPPSTKTQTASSS
jgi:hypothetical protein